MRVTPICRFQPDLDSLVGGQRFTTPARTIMRADVVSVQAGGREEMDGRSRDVAPAGLVLSYAIGLVPLVDRRIVAVRRSGDTSFKRAAYVGDTIHVEGTIDAVSAVDDETDVVRMAWDVVNQRGEQVSRMKVDAFWRRGHQLDPTCREQDYVKRESAAALPT
jgi:acyl dehydratase